MAVVVFRWTAADHAQVPRLRYWSDETEAWGPLDAASLYEDLDPCWHPSPHRAGQVEVVDYEEASHHAAPGERVDDGLAGVGM